ncbi:orotidine-5'-phosphate decarboxylase [Nonomuraea sp. NPDC050556]|uniref:orotidine-5'-phosphate decarboxylase n=1 Tax=Nonomuraea sp. NPDC050556 TaxID=3364369 RepID=UPI0037998D0D
MTESFGERLRAGLDKRGPLCVGIDPHPGLLHAWGLDDSPAGLERFCRTVTGAVGDLAAVVKPQSAFFERWGSRGVAVLEETIADLRAAGALVLLDVKRGDIGSTMSAYAEAYLDRGSPLAVDAITVSPYLGFGSLRVAIASALANDAGLFVLARTSNPEAAELQALVADQVFAGVTEVNAGASPMGSIGVVVGVPQDHPLERLNGPILAPGFGAQGATAADLPGIAGAASHNLVPSVSRAVLDDPALIRERAARWRDDFAEQL